MGLFDKLKGSKDIKLSPKGALALAAMTIISADGSVDEDEISGLKRIVRGDGGAFNEAYKVFKERSAADCVEAVTKCLNEKQRACVVANLVDIAMADGLLAGAEEKLLTAYVTSFSLPDDMIKKLIDAMQVKNDFSVFA